MTATPSALSIGSANHLKSCALYALDPHAGGLRLSRGAYTVRSLANLLILCGAPMKAPQWPAPALPQDGERHRLEGRRHSARTRRRAPAEGLRSRAPRTRAPVSDVVRRANLPPRQF